LSCILRSRTKITSSRLDIDDAGVLATLVEDLEAPW